MDRQHWEKMLPIIQAFLKGENIQIYYGNGEWHDVEDDMPVAFFGNPSDYRIKPKTRVIKTRRALMSRIADNDLIVTIWCDSYSTTQKDWEQDPKFLRWLEDTQTHEFEI